MEESVSSLGLIILGAVLATVGGLIAYFVQWAWVRKQHRMATHELVKDLLSSFTKLVPRIDEVHNLSGVLPAQLLWRIASDVAVYERQQEHLILVKDLKLREALRECFANIRATVAMCLGLVNWADPNQAQVDPQLHHWAKSEAPKQVARLKELRNEAQKLLSRV